MNPKKWRQFCQPQKNEANLVKPKKWHFHKFQTQKNDTSIPIKIFKSAPPPWVWLLGIITDQFNDMIIGFSGEKWLPERF